MSFHYDSFDKTRPLFPLQQHPHFAAAICEAGQQVTRHTLAGHGSAQIIARRFWPMKQPIQMVSRGPVWRQLPSADDQYAALTELHALGVHLINNEVVAQDIMKAAGYRMLMTPATIAVLNLQGTHDDRIAAMTAKWRNALRKGSHAGLSLEVQSFHPVTHDWILKADAAQQKTRHYRALPAALTQTYARRNDGQVIVVTASDGETPVATMLFLRHGDCATYHIGWTSTAGRACNAHNLCLSIAMDSLSASGVRSLDMGQIDTVHQAGLARFKLGSGALPQQLGGTWLRVPRFRRPRLA